MASQRWSFVVACLACISFATGAGSTLASYRQPLCSSWRLNVEVNNLRDWSVVPDSCESYVAAYISGSQYFEDSQVATLQASALAHLVFSASSVSSSSFVNFSYNAWVFDVDETSLSNAPYYAKHRFGAEAYNDTLFEAWVEEARAPVLPATLYLFNELKDLGFSVFFLTGRSEEQRNATVANLLSAGYSGWEGLILRQPDERGVAAAIYKSSKRKAIEDLGYTIIGNVGDQWSDLTGYSVGSRVFKLPNPMYYIA